MEKNRMQELDYFLNNTKITNPMIKVSSNQLMLSASIFNYNTITDLLLLIAGLFIFSKVNFDENITLSLILLLILTSSSWYNYMAINTIKINFETKTIIIKSKNPIVRIWLKITTKDNTKTIRFAGIESFYNRATLHLPSFRRYRLNVKLKDGRTFVLVDFNDEKKPDKLASHLNKLILN